MSDKIIRLGITVGDMSGIGLEVLYGALKSNCAAKYQVYLYANPQSVAHYYNSLFGSGNWSLPDKVKIISCGEFVEAQFANPNKEVAMSAILSLEKAANEALKNEIDAIVTLPIAKKVLQQVGWNFSGQTEFFAHAAQSSSYLMILCTKKVRVALASIHVPLHAVSNLINKERIEYTITLFAQSLKKDYGISDPKIAVLGLNPHAGESGSIGNEEIESIVPAIENIRKQGIEVVGCFPADGFFAHGEYKRYDGIIAMYHDQGLIPLKMLAQGGGVNVTAGLPLVRTSPDHGTAYGIAGKNMADSRSMAEAIDMAAEIVKNRRAYASNNVEL